MDSNESSSISSSEAGRHSSTSSTLDQSISTGRSRCTQHEHAELAERETHLIARSRILFVVLLIMLAAIASSLTYYFLRSDETHTFESEFESFAMEIDDAIQNNAKNVYNSMAGLSTTITSFALATDAVWPNVTLPHYPKRGASVLQQTGAELIAFSPVVETSLNEGWEAYSQEELNWIGCSLDLSQAEVAAAVSKEISSHKQRDEIIAVHQWIADSTGIPLEEIEDIYQIPAWQMYPMEQPLLQSINFDLLSHPSFHRLFHWMAMSKEPVFSEVIDIPALLGLNETEVTEVHSHSLLIQPVFKSFEECEFEDDRDCQKIGGLVFAVLPWDVYLDKLLQEDVKGIYVEVSNSCGDLFTYRVDGSKATFLTGGEHHEAKYEDIAVVAEFQPWVDKTDKTDTVNCHYQFTIYPSSQLEDEYHKRKPALLTFAVAMIFMLTTVVFVAYDCLVQRRQDKVMDSAKKTNAIVSSLFPAEVRDRLFTKSRSKRKAQEREANKKSGGLLPALPAAPKFRLNHFLTEEERLNAPAGEGDTEMIEGRGKPIADLFPHATVMFADIAGFTAWSSVRDPSQVFTLLETVYRAFDRIAKRRGVFKVETIGDSYVAVVGLPEQREDHAVVMARFCRECLAKMNELTTKLEEVLGPDTGDLTMRFGLHSGPVTAGVLRGEKSRFQLFGDTVNTASRMESTGVRNRIQLSEETAGELRGAGKEHWLLPREDKVEAKGKGLLQTYWLHVKDDRKRTKKTDKHEEGKAPDGEESDENDEVECDTIVPGEDAKKILQAKKERMVEWTVDILSKLLQQIVATRNAAGKHSMIREESLTELEDIIGRGDSTIQEEVTEFVPLPEFDMNLADSIGDYNMVKLPVEVIHQLHRFVKETSSLYRDNPFHNFEHASHVTMSISKLLGRIVAADVHPAEKDQGQGRVLEKLHERTYGIFSDPLTQFAAVFSGLIHDVDHQGLPNFLLIKEDPELAAMYKCRSVAEQNSVDIAWERLMEPEFKALRRCIYTTSSELRRFRQTVVNTVMATDIFDKGYGELRKRRWDKCFHPENRTLTSNDLNRRATIVVEHLIQASDVAHTMQHWQIYQKWNVRLFEEMYKAYKSGRSDKDPSENWYMSEIGFFDNYIIPLAKKLKECGVFGVSSDEYLNYAIENRREWSIRGEKLVAESVAKFEAMNS